MTTSNSIIVKAAWEFRGLSSELRLSPNSGEFSFVSGSIPINHFHNSSLTYLWMIISKRINAYFSLHHANHIHETMSGVNVPNFVHLGKIYGSYRQ